MSSDLDIGPLSWVKGEIDLALERADAALTAHAASPDGDALVTASKQLHQAHGALTIVGLAGVTEFADALEAHVAKLVAGTTPWSAQAAQVAHAALAALRGYLDSLMGGEANQTLRLMPAYQALCKAAGQPVPAPSALFFPDLSQRPPRREVEPPTLAADKLAGRLRLARVAFARGVQKWQKPDGSGVRRGITEMRNAVAMVEATRQQPGERALWWSALGFYDALAKEGYNEPEADALARDMVFKVGAQIGHVFAGQNQVPERLLAEMLYLNAIAQCDSDLVRVVRAAYGLEQLLPRAVNADLDSARPKINRLRELLAAAKDDWNRLCAGVAAALPPFHDKITQVAERAAELHNTGITALTRAALELTDSLRRDPSLHSESIALEMATALLLCESALDNFASLDAQFDHDAGTMAARLSALISGSSLDALELPHLDDMARRAQERLLLATVAREITINLTTIEQTLDAYFRDPGKQATLAALDRPVRQIEGALLILGQDRAHAVLGECHQNIRALADGQTPPQKAVFEALAGKLSAIGFFVEQLEAGAQADIDSILNPPSLRDSDGAAPGSAGVPGSETPAHAVTAAAPPTAPVLPASGAAASTPAESGQASASGAAPKPTPPALAPTDASEVDPELLEIFLEEAREVLATIADQLPAVHARPDDSAALVTLRRSFHTLKGSGRMVHLNALGEAAWDVEQVMNLWLQEKRAASAPLLNMLDAATTLFSAWVGALAAAQTPDPDVNTLTGLCRALLSSEVAAAADDVTATPAPPVTEPDTAPFAPTDAAQPAADAAVPEIEAIASVIEAVVPADGAQRVDGATPGPETYARAAVEESGVNAESAATEPSVADMVAHLAARELAADAQRVEDELVAAEINAGDIAAAADRLTTDQPPTVPEVSDTDADWNFSADATPAVQELPEETPVTEATAELTPPPVDEDDLAAAEMAAAEILAEAENAAEAELLTAPPTTRPEAAVTQEELSTSPASDAPQALISYAEVPAIASEEGEGEGSDDNIRAFPAPAPIRIGSRDISPTLFAIYIEEAQQHLATIAHELSRPGVPSDALIRAAHTLGSTSGTTGIEAIHHLARALEIALGGLAIVDAQPSEAQQLLLARCAGALEGMFGAVKSRRMPSEETALTAELREMKPEGMALVSTAVPAEPAAVSEFQLPAAPVDDAPVAPPIDEDEELPETRHGQRLEDEIDEQLLPIFLEEAADLMASIDAQLRGWRNSPENEAFPRQLQRDLHTIKGSARMAGAMGCGDVFHAMESRIEQGIALRNIGTDLFETLETSYDRGALLIERLQRGDYGAHASIVAPVQAPAGVSIDRSDAVTISAAGGISGSPVAEHLPEPAALEREASKAVLAGAATTAVPAAQVHLRVRADLIDSLVNDAGEVAIARARIEGEMRALKASLLELTDNVIRLRHQVRDIEIQAETQMASQITELKAQAEMEGRAFDPLEFDRFTRFQELTRMMAESVNDVSTVQHSLLVNVTNTDAALNAQARLNRELSQRLMGVRMMPFDSLAERLHRVVRQAAKEVGKRANLDIKGGQMGIDRSVLEHIGGPLEHLLRNAVAHGLEMPPAREAAGKPSLGQITLSLAQEGNDVVLSLADDGGGLDLPRIHERAIARGLLAADAQPDDSTLIGMIFEPGFSTAESVSTLAGRGVGMDVVKTEIEGLGGRIEISSVRGAGSTFRLYLPLTLAVSQAVIILVGHRSYALPASMVEQASELKPDVIAKIREKGSAEWLGRSYPYRYLPQLLGMDLQPAAARRHWLLYIKGGSERLAIEIDGMVGNREIVIKNLGLQLRRIPGLAGATVLGNGEIGLILNPIALLGRQPVLEHAASASVAVHAPAAPALDNVRKTAADSTVLVVDDSLTVRKVTGRLLGRQGYQVVTAKDGVDALEQLGDIHPDVMLVDIEMPRMDGFELTRNIRADAKLKRIPIIMITSRSADKHRQYAKEIGVNHYLGKPYDEAELLRLIDAFINPDMPA